MLLRLSYHEFCWLCRAPWNTHGEQTGGYYACNRYETSPVRCSGGICVRSSLTLSAPQAKAEDDNAEKVKEELRRFLHYYERYQQHHRSKEIAAKLADAAPLRLRQYQVRFLSPYLYFQPSNVSFACTRRHAPTLLSCSTSSSTQPSSFKMCAYSCRLFLPFFYLRPSPVPQRAAEYLCVCLLPPR